MEEKQNIGKEVSVLQGNELFNKRIISRQSSVGLSSRIYYRSSEGLVPFKWEMEPGKPRYRPENEYIPAISPPPAMHSLGLPKPKPFDEVDNKKSTLSTFWFFWKKITRNRRRSKKEVQDNTEIVSGSDKFERFEFSSSSDGKFTTSLPSDSSASSSSLSLSLSSPASSNGASHSSRPHPRA